MRSTRFATWCTTSAVLASLAACGFEGTGPAPGSPSGDGSDGPDGSDGIRCDFEYLSVCGLTAGPDRSYTGNVTLDTSNPQTCTHVVAQPAGPEVCVIYAPSITIASGATVRGLGTRPLALVSRGDIIINGTLSVGSRSQGSGSEQIGAGALSHTCPAPARTPVANSQGGGGGAGATFRGAGGAGGKGNNTHLGGLASTAMPAPTILHGGCRGQNGGDGTQAQGGGAGGPPGGSLLLAAHGAIRLAGAGSRVAAGGGSGRGGRFYGGGGGAGSGGLIVLEASQVVNEGAVRAQGGGGGQASYHVGIPGGPVPGGDGEDAGDNTMRADGAGLDDFACTGGDGSTDSTLEGQGAEDGFAGAGAGGGGGGGGAGFVIVRGARSGAGTYSPAPQ